MKVLLLSMLMLFISCGKPCPKIDRLFKFGDTVIVTDGFYKGLDGIITSTYEQMYKNENSGILIDFCVIPAYTIQTLFGSYKITQDSLEFKK